MKLAELFLQHTPYEEYALSGLPVTVKREDLYCRDDIAPLAKMRGVNRVMERLANDGVETVGVFDFKVSRAGVGIAAMSQLLGIRCIECYQWYKSYITEGLPWQQVRCAEWGAELYPIKASRLNINFAVGKRYVQERGGYMFPRGIILDETLQAVEDEVVRDKEVLAPFKDIVICAGSGTISTGLLRGLVRCGFTDKRLHAVCCTNSVMHCKRLHQYLCDESRFAERPAVRLYPASLEYYTESTVECPFPSHPNYDRKAWEWLEANIHKLPGPVLFWNIGA